MAANNFPEGRMPFQFKLPSKEAVLGGLILVFVALILF